MAETSLPVVAAPGLRAPAARARLVRKAKLLAWLGIGWHAAEFAVAIVAGLAAGSIALIGFGVDSLVESAAGVVVLWRFSSRRSHTDGAERRAQQLIAGSFFLLAAYVAVEAVRALAIGDQPDASWVGVGLAAVTIVTMPPLAHLKRRVGNELGSSATVKEGVQNLLCAYMSVALLVGLLANAVAGWWWADPLAALAIAGLAAREGVESWRGRGCCDAC